jgi:cyclase
MLKKRVAACLVVKNGIVVQSILYKKYLPVGKPHIAVEFLNQWGIDEIILLDISATKEERGPDVAMIRTLAKKCFVPLTVGGGVTNLDQVKELMSCGADKISINRKALVEPKFISMFAHEYGNQCVVVSIDVVGNKQSEYKVYDYLSGAHLDIDLVTWAQEVEEYGAGEIFLTAVERDGSYRGFDVELIDLISEKVDIPVIASGGAGNAEHFHHLFHMTSASAGCAANFFHFTEHSVNITKSHLVKKKLPVRLETHADYGENEFDREFRLRKKNDQVLEDMLFIRIEKEII